jgi:hypothetical protein
MNIIENVWNQLEYEDKLFAMLQEEWAKLSAEYCAKLYASLLRRINQLRLAKGFWTEY